MARTIKGNEVIQDNHLENAVKSGEQYLNVVKKINSELKNTAKIQKEVVKGLGTNSSKGIAGINAEFEKSARLKKAALDIAKKEEQLKQSQIRTENALLNQKKKAEAEERKRIKALRDANSEYKRQSKLLEDLRRRFKDLVVSGRGSGKVARGLKIEIDKLNASLTKADRAAGQFGRNVGNYPKTLKLATASIRQFATALGFTSGIYLLVNGIRDSIGIIKNFDEAVTNLGAISRKTAEELKPLTDQALELGGATQFTATQIVGLQIELAKLGFTMKEIKAAAEPISQFAIAVGTEIPRAAKLAGSAVRGFNLDVDETQRVVSTLGVATTKTALDFSFLETALSIVAPVATTFGFTIEETTSLLGKLADSGFDASSAATATRNILLNLADSSGKLAQELGRPVTNLSELAEGLIELDRGGIDLAETLELTDKRSVAAFNTFIRGANDLVKLKTEITDVNEELKEMADKRLESVEGRMGLLISEWERLNLTWSKALGLADGIKSSLTFLTDNLGLITTIIARAIKLFLVYKSVVIALTIRTKALALAQKLATDGMKAFNLAAKLNPIGLVITGIYALVTAIGFLDSSFEENTRVTNENIDARSSLKRVSDEVTIALDKELAELDKVFDALKRTKAGTLERKEALEKTNDTYDLTLKNLKDEKDFLNQVNIAYRNLANEIEAKVTAQIVEEEITELLIRKRKLLRNQSKLDLQDTRERSKLQKELNELLSLPTLGEDVVVLKNRQVAIEELKEKLEDLGEGSGFAQEEIDSIDKTVLKLLATIKKADKLEFTPRVKDTKLTKAELEAIKKEQERLNGIVIDNRLIAERRGKKVIKDIEDEKIKDAKKSADERLRIEFERLEAQEKYEKKLEEDRRKRFEESIRSTATLINTTYKDAQEKLSLELNTINNNIQESQQSIQSLQEQVALGNLEAKESIKAEKLRIANEQAKIEELEKKKKDLLIVTTSLTLALNKLESGDGSGLQNAGNEVQSFIDRLRGFYDGTETTVGAALGNAYRIYGDKDTHIAKVHKDETILGVNNSRKLNGMTQDEITKGALLFKNGDLAGKTAVKSISHQYFTDIRIVEAMNRNTEAVTKAINSIPESSSSYDAIKGVWVDSVKRGNKIERNHRPIWKF